jgi:hypothetical protein
LWSATESTGGSIFHNAPFLQHLLESVSKVDLGFLKDHIPADDLDCSGREQGPATMGCRVSKRGVF